MPLDFGPQTHTTEFDKFIYQGDQPSCAIRSQELVLRDYGIHIPQDELIKYATEQGWYDHGTRLEDVGKLLETCHVSCHTQTDASIYDLINELSAGHRVIVGVDAHELWHDKGPLGNWIADHFTDPNHALIVTSINVDVEDPNRTMVVVTDPGSGEITEYPLKQFAHSWGDSNCFMVATDEPAPYQYNAETQMMEYSNFATDYTVTQFPFHNEFSDIYTLAEMESEPFYEEGHLDFLMDDLAYADFNEAFQNHDYSALNESFEFEDDFLSNHLDGLSSHLGLTDDDWSQDGPLPLDQSSLCS